MSEAEPAYRFGAEPIVVGPQSSRDLGEAAQAVVALSLALPQRLAAIGRLADVLDADPDWLEFLLEPPTGLEGCLSRPDLIYAHGRFQCVDANVAHAGGWNANALWTGKVPADVLVSDPLEAVFDLVHRQAAKQGVVGAGQPVCAVVVASPDDREFASAALRACRPAWLAAARRDGRPAGPLHFVEHPGPAFDGGSLWCGGDRVHAIIEGAVLDGPHRLRWNSLAKRGALSLHSGPIASVLNDRRLLAELSRAADIGDPVLTAEECALVRQHVPWTRPLRDTGRAVAERDRLVLKRADSAGGTAVYVGMHTPAGDWADLVRTAAGKGGWVVQRYLEPELPADVLSELEDAHIVWGTFVVEAKAVGGFVRVLRPDGYRAPGAKGAISVADGPNGDDRITLLPIGRSLSLGASRRPAR